MSIDSKSKSFELISGISSSRLRLESFARKYVKDNNVCVDPKSVRETSTNSVGLHLLRNCIRNSQRETQICSIGGVRVRISEREVPLLASRGTLYIPTTTYIIKKKEKKKKNEIKGNKNNLIVE